MKRLKQTERLVDDAYTTVSRLGAKVYDAVKHQNPERWARTTVAEAASLMFPQASLIMIFATHKYLMNHPTHFVAHPHYHTLHAFNVRPQSHVDELSMTIKWSRLRDGPMQAFGDKARTVIQKYQNVYQRSHAGAPGQIPGDHSWNFKDKVILSFLLRSLRPYRSTQSDPYSIGQSAILKAIDPKGPPIDAEEVQKVLVKLGVIAPWQDLQVLSPDLDLDLDNETSSPRVHAQNAVVAKGFSAPEKKGPLGPEDFYLSDPLDSVRHDFGDAPVFVIDEPEAEELDDGFSIERIPSEPDNFWVHVHIADPASVIPPTHVLAKEAAMQMETVYFLHRSWPLLPKSLVHSPQYGLSLGSRKNLPNRVLTISGKVNDEGHILDTKVRAGIIRNINPITYDAVDFALNLPPIVRSYPFGGEPPKPLFSPIPDAHVKDLRDLMLVRDRLIAKRYRGGAYVPNFATADIVNLQHIPTDIESPTFKPSIFEGFPKFGYSVAYAHERDVGARALVAEMMKLACRVVSQFCLERDIPALRRVAEPPLLTSDTDLQALLNMRTPNTYVPMNEFSQCLEYQPSGDYSLEPKEHFGLGVADGEGYVKATSPLRRYMDLVVHWQLHHALLGSAAPTKHYPFSAEQLQEIAVSARASDKTLKNAEQTHNRYWLTMFLKRWAEDTARGVERQDDPLKRLHCLTVAIPVPDTETRKYHTEVLIPALGMRGALVNLENDELPKGTLLEVDIHSFRLGIRPRLAVHIIRS
jgi:exoribonuclease-2